MAAVFAIHPLRVESVAWVAERKDVLSGLLFMLTLWLYARYARRPASWGRYLLVVASFALGLMAKPMLVTLPLVLLLLDYWPLGRMSGRREGGAGESMSDGALREPVQKRDERRKGSIRRTIGYMVLTHPTFSLERRRGRHQAPSTAFLRLLVEKIPLFVLAAASCTVTLAAQRNAMRSLEQMDFCWASRQCRGGVRRLPRENALPGRLGCPLSASQGATAGMESDCGGRRAVGDFRGRLPGKAEVPLLALRLALVSWHPGAGDRTGAGGRPGDGRPLHVFAADRPLRGHGLGRGGHGRLVAAIVVGHSRPSRRWWWQR